MFTFDSEEVSLENFIKCLRHTSNTFMFKGIECYFSQVAGAIVPTDDKKQEAIDFLFQNEPINSIKWITDADFNASIDNKDEDGLEIYTMGSSDGITLVFMPYLYKNDLILHIQTLDEVPSIKSKITL